MWQENHRADGVNPFKAMGLVSRLQSTARRAAKASHEKARPGSGQLHSTRSPAETPVSHKAVIIGNTEESLIYTLEALQKGKSADLGFLVIVVLNYKERLCSEDIWLA